MPQATIINNFGTVIGWNQHEVVVLGRTVEGITKIVMKDNQEVEGVYAAGKYPVGIGEGNYSAEFGMTLLLEEVQFLLDSLPPGSTVQDIPPFDVPVLTIRNGVIKKDVATSVKIKGLGKEVSQGDKSVAMEIPCFCPRILWNQQ